MGMESTSSLSVVLFIDKECHFSFFVDKKWKDKRSIMSFCKLDRFTSTHHFSHCTVTVWITNKIDSIYSKFSTCDRLLSYTVFVLANDCKYRQNAPAYSTNRCSHQTCSRHRDYSADAHKNASLFEIIKLAVYGPHSWFCHIAKKHFFDQIWCFLQ